MRNRTQSDPIRKDASWTGGANFVATIPTRIFEEHDVNPKLSDKQVHIFDGEGTTFLFDVESTKFFRIDAVVRDILELWNSYPESRLIRELQKKYSNVTIKEAISEIRELEQQGFLFQEARQSAYPSKDAHFKTRIVTFTLNFVAGCNLRCKYCWNDGGQYVKKNEGKMSRETAKRAIDFLVEHSYEGDEITVDFYGGEPFLNFEVMKSTVDYCNEIKEKVGRKFDYKITTNGTIMNEEILEFLRSRKLSIGVSLDGPKEIHDTNRPYRNGEGSWDDIVTNVKKVMNTNEIGVSIKATLAPRNLNKLEVFHSLTNMGFSDVEVGFASERSRLFNENNGFVITAEDVETMKKEYLAFARFYLKELLENDNATDVMMSNNISRVYYETPKFTPCGAGRNNLCVSGAGDLYPCMGFVGIEEYKLGDVFSGLLIDKFDRFCQQINRFVFQNEECMNCWSKYLCGGLCPANNVQYNGDLKMPYRKGCDFQKFQNEVSIWLISEMLNKNPSLMNGFKPIG